MTRAPHAILRMPPGRRASVLLSVALVAATPAGAQQHPSIGLNAPDIPTLRQRAGTTHADIWNEILVFTDDHLGTLPPAESELPDVSSAVPWRILGESPVPFAFSFLVSDDPAYASLTKDWILGMCEWSYWGPRSQDNHDLGAAYILYGVSVGYDWIYDQLSPGERDFIRDKVALQANILWRYATGAEEASWTDTYRQNHNHVNNVALAVAGHVFRDEHPDAGNWEEQALENLHSVLDAFEGVTDGSFHEGYQYWTFSLSYLLIHLDLLKGQYGIDLFEGNEWLSNSVYSRLYGMMPDPTLTLDIADSSPHHRSPRNVLRKLASEYRNGHAEWIVQRRGPDSTPWTVRMSPWEFLWYDPGVDAEDPTGLPLAWHLPDWGVVTMRSGWEEGDTFLSFKSGAPGGRYGFEQVRDGVPGAGTLGAYHDHPDQNSFTLFAAGEYLATDNGDDLTPKRTAFQNTVLVDGSGQIGEGATVFNEAHPEFWQASGRILEFDRTSTAAYVAGDASSAYPSALGLTKFVRQILFLLPDVFLMVDNLEATHPVDYNWILRNRMGSFAVVGRWVFSIVENSWLRMRVLEPASFRYRVLRHPKQYRSLELTPGSPSAEQRFVMGLVPSSRGARTRYRVEQIPSSSGDVGVRVKTPDGDLVALLRGDIAADGAPKRISVGRFETDGTGAVIRRDSNGDIVGLTLLQGSECVDTVDGRRLVSMSARGTIDIGFTGSKLTVEYGPGGGAREPQRLSIYSPRIVEGVEMGGSQVPFTQSQRQVHLDLAGDVR